MVEGVQGFNTFMTKTVERAVREAAKKSLRDSAQQLVYALQAVAPYETGELRTAITYRITEDENSVAATIIGGDRRTVEGSHQKARVQEFGTVKMAANPWFFPMYRRRRRAINNKLNRDIKKAIRSAAGGAS